MLGGSNFDAKISGITIQICTVIIRLLFFHRISEIGRPKQHRDGCRQQRNQRKAQARSSRSLRETPLPSSSYALVALFQLLESHSNLLTGRPTSMPQTERRSGGWPGLWQGDWEQDCLWMGWTWRCIGYWYEVRTLFHSSTISVAKLGESALGFSHLGVPSPDLFLGTKDVLWTSAFCRACLL